MMYNTLVLISGHDFMYTLEPLSLKQFDD